MTQKSKEKFRSLAALALILMFALPVSALETYYIKAKMIYTVSQMGIIHDGVIQVKDGKLGKVGKSVDIPPGASVMEAEVVMPGLIDIHSHLGVYSLPLVPENADLNEMSNPVTPQLKALDAFNFNDPAIPVAREGGVTTIVSRPGSTNVIGGVSLAVKLKKASPDEMILKDVCDLKMAIEGNPVDAYGTKKQAPATLMSVYFLARKAFLEALEYREKWEKYEKEKKVKKDLLPPPRDLGLEMLVKALRREIPVHIHCATASEIASCLRLKEEFNLKMSLAHCSWAHLIVDELKRYPDVHYNVGPAMFMTYYDNLLEFKNTPAILANAGLKVSIHTDAVGGAQQNLLHLARICYRYGLSEEDAIRSITLSGAEAIGLENRIGSLEEGKDADLIFLDGEPMEFTTSVVKVIIDGRVEQVVIPRRGKSLDLNISEASGKLDLPEEIQAGPLAIKGGTIITMAGNSIRNGFILIKDGKIEKIAAGNQLPAGYKVIDASEYVIMPGLISPRSYTGVLANWRQQSSIDEISNPVVPELEIKHAVEPQAPHFVFSRQVGITTALITPGNKNIMGGQGVVVKTEGSVIDRMIVRDRAVMVFGLGDQAKREGQPPLTRMAIASMLRETLTRAREYMTQKNAGRQIPCDFKLEALIPVLKREMPVLVHGERSDDILTMIKIADEFNLRIILDGAAGAHKIVEAIKERNIPVIIEDFVRGAGNIEDKEFTPETPAILSRAGVLVAFRANEGWWVAPGVGWGGGDLLELAALAVKNGMAEEEALKAITINAAKIIGADDRIGSLEIGKDADLIILRGHPLKSRSIPEAVMINGKIVYRRKANENL